MSGRTLTSILKEACIVTLTGAPDCDAGQTEQRVLVGEIVQDFSGRFRRRHLCTSLIDYVEGDIVKTRNSFYQTVGEVIEVSLPWQALALIRSGVHPLALERLMKATPIREVSDDV